MSGFGRKGLESQPGAGPAPQNYVHTGGEGLRNSARAPLHTQPRDGQMSSKAEAFIASERARKAENAQARSIRMDGPGISDFAADYRSSAPPERSLVMAYVLWFVLGQVSAHRFYLGAYRSACAQVGLFAFWLVVAMSTPTGAQNTVGPILAIAVIGWCVWVIGDVFFIRRIHRKLCRQPDKAAAVFA